MKNKNLFWGIDISTSFFNQKLSANWQETQEKYGLHRMGAMEEGLIAIGKVCATEEERMEVTQAIEIITGERNGEFSFSYYNHCGNYELRELID